MIKSKNESMNIFTKAENLKFSPYWSKIENYINRQSFNKNITELLVDAMDEETTRLIWTLQHVIPLEDAKELSYSILNDAIDKAVGYIDIGDEDLYFLIIETTIPLLDEYFDGNKTLRKFAAGLIDSCLKNFIRLKRGADVFCDISFSDSIITDGLEDDSNISALFAFITALGPNVFLNDYLDEGSREGEA